MSHDYSDEEDFQGFSDHDDSQVFISISDGPSEDHSRLYDDEASEVAFGSDDEPKHHTGFVDDEASEADSDSDSDSESDITYETNNAIFPDTLHKFKHLPAELREMIWKAFCPDLSVLPRVYELSCDEKVLRFAAHVEDQTAPLRAVLAVHRESRALGHKFAPHLIQLRHGQGVAPCHMERDVLFVGWTFDHRYCPWPEELDMLAEAAPGLQNLAITMGTTFFDGGAELDRLYSLKNVFIAQDAEDVSARGLTWCVSDKNHSYHLIHQEESEGLISEAVDILFYWPDPDKYGESGERSFSSRNFASLEFDQEGTAVNAVGEGGSDDGMDYSTVSNWGYEIARLREYLDPLHKMNQSSGAQSRSGSSEPETEERDNPTTPEGAQEKEPEEERGNEEDEGGEGQSSPPRPHRICVWPFTRFMFASGVDRLEALKAWKKPWEDWESDQGSYGYMEESSDMDSDNSLNDFIAPDDPIDLETDDDDEEASSQSGDEEGASRHTAQGQDLGFESVEEDESSAEIGEPSRARKTDRVVIDLADSSDKEEDENGENTKPQRAGSSSRRARARPIPVDSEDDDDDDLPQPSRAGARRAAALLSESDDDANGDQNGGPKSEDEQNSSSEEDEDVSDEEEEAPPPKISLAKRLRLEAAQARAALAADDSDDEDQDGDASDDERDASDEDEMTMGIVDEDEEEDEEAW